MHEVKKVYFCQFDYHVDEEWGDCCAVAVTTDISEAEKMDEHYKLATISEVNSCIEDLELEDGYIKIIETADGIYGWMEYGWLNEYGEDDYFCEYVKLRCNMEDEINGMKEFMGKLRSL